MSNATNLPELVRARDVMKMLGINRMTLHELIERGVLPRPMKLSHNLRYWEKTELLAALRSYQ
jgi:predicted DNA-binding transcriptional regulator AlpA